MLPIVKAPHSLLATPSKKVTTIDKSIRQLIEQMKETLSHTRDPEGVGLAAPQIGKSLQLFIMKESSKAKVQAFINPVIEKYSPFGTFDTSDTFDTSTKKAGLPAEAKAEAGPRASEDIKKQNRSRKKGVKLEGCLSLPRIWGVVQRFPEVTLSYQDETGKHHKKTFKGFQATVIQHEIDHLQGVLFPKRVLEQKGKLYKSHKNKKGEDEFEEMEI